ncbi:MAG: cyclase family protein [Chloroflexi bacterium]|nr:cyclase family protein [Chloroflexota bacterium]MYF81698.1 cyclase family protein [Chloroflexota bacterium]MYI05046.1 cyclase family protein [Chloroflexota bacterium]
MATQTGTRTDVDALAQQLSNWGRWGDDDERGALNFITPEVSAAAAAQVSEGVTVSCALELAKTPAADNPTPVTHFMTGAGDVSGLGGLRGLESTGDGFVIAPHGMANTHIDALCHILDQGRMYNGFPASEVLSTGARKNSIMGLEQGIATRGVLLDIARARGNGWLEPGYGITVDDLEAAEAAQGVTVRSGDILLVRTGRDNRREVEGATPPFAGMAGLLMETLPWIREREVAILGCDGVSDVIPSNVEGSPLPIHHIIITYMGVHLIDNARLGPLGEACAERNRWEFLLTIAPLRLVGGTASPINPIAMF